MSSIKQVIVINDAHSHQRLDKTLAILYPEQSRTYFQGLIENGWVLLNGKIPKKREKTQTNDQIEIHFVITPDIHLEPENIPLEILFEDDYLLILNKPAGMVVHPAPGNWHGTIVNALLHHCCSLEGGVEPLRPGIVHRLDKDTSGLLVAAKTPTTHARLVDLFTHRQIDKRYLAVCLGNPGEVTFDQPIGRHPTQRKKMSVLTQGGKEAITLCHVLGYDHKISIVELTLKTGRTHQIRVHLQHNHTPIIGDATYGNPQVNKQFQATRQMLHAKSLQFIHPMTQQPLHIVAAPPDDMLALIRTILPNFTT